MNLEVFCYVGLLCFPEQMDSCLFLFRDAEEQKVRNILQELRPLARGDLLQRWSKLRREEYASMSRELVQGYGIDLDRLPPSLHPWCASWWAENHG